MPATRRSRRPLAVALTGAICGAAAVNAAPVIPSTEEAVARGLLYVMQGPGVTYGFYGYGCALVDVDADGDPDAVIIGAADGRVGVFENDGTGHFTDRSFGNGIPLLPRGSGLAAGDYDGDGDLDLYFTQAVYGGSYPNVLVRNDGGFAFTDVTVAAGVADTGAGKGASFGDYDGDGWLDLYVCNYGAGIVNVLYHNLGDGTFEEVGAALGVDDVGFGFEAVWSDLDRDGDVDLYLSNDRGHLGPLQRGNQLWRNDGGTLVNVSAGSGADLHLYSMGIACGDFDGNSWPDLYVTNIPWSWAWGPCNPLMLNQGGLSFTEASGSAGVANPWTSWGAIFYDFDNDGHLDLYVNNETHSNALYLNGGGFPCLEAGSLANVAGSTGASYGSAVGDVDLDGDLDLLLNNMSSGAPPFGAVQLFINHSYDEAARRSIRYRLVGQGANRFAVGGNVDTRIGETWQFREILAGGNSYIGENDLLVHVGVADALVADEVVVRWPGGATTRTLTNLPTGETWTVYPPERLGDVDGDGTVGLDDYFAFAACYGGAVSPGCEMMDFDGDSAIDLDDFDGFLAAYGPPVEDCDGNGDPDLLQILLDPDLDMNGDGALDACACAADLDGSGDVGFADIIVLLAAWGPCPGCPADLDGSGDVGFADIIVLLAAWGACG